MHSHPPQRGFALILALLVVVMVTLLVAGAINFTGTERAASAAQMRDDQLSACVQAARNTFLSRIRLIGNNTENIQLVNVALDPGSASDQPLSVSTRHYTLGSDAGVPLATIKNVTKLPPEAVGATNSGISDISNVTGGGRPGQAAFYSISVLCQERAGGPEREVEFTVRVGQ
jgi:hypothetical protein